MGSKHPGKHAARFMGMYTKKQFEDYEAETNTLLARVTHERDEALKVLQFTLHHVGSIIHNDRGWVQANHPHLLEPINPTGTPLLTARVVPPQPDDDPTVTLVEVLPRKGVQAKIAVDILDLETGGTWVDRAEHADWKDVAESLVRVTRYADADRVILLSACTDDGSESALMRLTIPRQADVPSDEPAIAAPPPL